MNNRTINRQQLRSRQAFLREQNNRWPVVMAKVPKSEWPAFAKIPPAMVFRSSGFLAQFFDAKNGAIRLTVNRTTIDSTGGWEEGISWDELMKVKSECGFGDAWAVEIFPPDDEVVNVASMRHLWILPSAPDFAWKKGLIDG